MKIIKRIGIGIAGVIVLLLVVALFTRKEYTLQKEITINKPKGEVFDYIRFSKNGEHYNKWVMADPHMKKDYRGTDGTVGFVYAWESADNGVGKGEQETRRITEGEQVDFEVRFIKPFEGRADTRMTTAALDEGTTRVQWTFSSGMKYPMNLVLLFFEPEDLLGRDMATSLSNLKTVLESGSHVTGPSSTSAAKPGVSMPAAARLYR